MESKLTNHY